MPPIFTFKKSFKHKQQKKWNHNIDGSSKKKIVFQTAGIEK